MLWILCPAGANESTTEHCLVVLDVYANCNATRLVFFRGNKPLDSVSFLAYFG